MVDDNSMTYAEALAYVADLAPRGWRLGLDRMQEFARRAGLDAPSQRFIHIAGTNGKGSVTAFVQSLLIAQGHRTGAFFSPFVYDPRERVQVGRDLVTEEAFIQAVERLAPVAAGMEDTEFQGPTEFEFKTAIGLEVWRQAQCEWVALEVGLGGRLDATNIVPTSASIVTSIGLDHMAILGATEELIAAEKGGIFKPGVPVVLGQMRRGPEAVLMGMARDVGCSVWRYGHEIHAEPAGRNRWHVSTPGGTYTDLESGLAGPVQGRNLAVAIAALGASGAIVDRSKVTEGAMKAFCPGRYERRGRYILDGAHNEQAAHALVEILRSEGHGEGSLTLVTSMVNGHESLPFYQALKPMVRAAVVGPIDFPRAQPVEKVAAAVEAAGIPATTANSVEDAIRGAEEREGTILVAGSFYFVGEVGNYLASKGLGRAT